ncbi:LemA family [Delftia tsuruhatensis]|uniref:LemA family protein n=1 Tax=Delftia tsuruhatensis TaxID=180282 RepID=UPI001E70D857|nr:LemA family protein [Delftia tsuruhatensis]CAB5686429.1 LemA family [Delftia tsuruhatensis]CAC9690417.1 LemA family [Delftia tsuruhatensis]
MDTGIWLVLALVLACIWAVVTYNRLRQLHNRVENAYGQIDVQLKRRHDLIPNLVEVARGYMAHEAQTLEAVARARSQAVGAASTAREHPGQAGAMGALAMAEQALGGSLGRLMALSEAYPELRADERMQSLAEEIASTENRIGFARQAYNDQVLEYNDRSSRFPDLLIARLLGFAHLQMLQATQSSEERLAPQVRF